MASLMESNADAIAKVEEITAAMTEIISELTEK